MILQAENKILRAKAGLVNDPNSPEIKNLTKKMVSAMFAEPDGIGVAAPQIGESLQIFLVAEDVLFPKRFESESLRTKNFLTFINPRLLKVSSKKGNDVEGCLSVRGKYGDVVRPEKVSLEYLDEAGKKRSRGASGLFARVIQHEMDHLSGVLFIDKASNLRKFENEEQP